MCEGMATDICNRVWDVRQATKVSEAYADDDIPQLQIIEDVSTLSISSIEVLEQLASERIGATAHGREHPIGRSQRDRTPQAYA